MDDTRFDHLTKSIAGATSRRQLLRGLIGSIGAGAFLATHRKSGEAAVRPKTPTPTPLRCPGKQIVVGGKCACPSGFDKCGAECCPHGSAVCCDNACCYGQCYGEELCCPGVYCEAGGCCGVGQDCCADSGCCDGVCYHDAADGRELCCSADRYCAPSGECCDAGSDCCGSDGCCAGQCYNASDGRERCCPTGTATLCGPDCCLNETEVCCEGADGSTACVPIEIGCNPPEECSNDEDCGIGRQCCAGVCAYCCNDGDCNQCQTCQGGTCTPPTANPCGGDLCCENLCCFVSFDVPGVCCAETDKWGNSFKRCCAGPTCGYQCCDDDDCVSPDRCVDGRCVECVVAEQCGFGPDSLGPLCCDNTCYEGDCCITSDCQPGETCVANVCTPINGG